MSAVQTLLEKSKPIQEMEKTVAQGQLPLTLSGTPDSVRPQVVDAIQSSAKRPVIVLTPTENLAREYAARSGSAMFLPDTDLTLRDVDSKSREDEMERLSVLKRADSADTVYMSFEAAMQPVVPKDVLLSSCIDIAAGDVQERDDLAAMLTQASYERVGTVYSRGEFAVRGEIVDVFPTDSENPVRITFFDNEIESLRYFDADTQKSIGKPFDAVVLPPAREVVLTDEARTKLSKYLRGQKGALAKLGEELAGELEEFGAPGNIHTLLSAAYSPVSPIEYFDNPVIVYDGLDQIMADALRLTREYESEYQRLSEESAVLPIQKEGLLPFEKLLNGHEGSTVDLASFSEGPLGSGKTVDLKISSASAFSGRMQLLADTVRKYSTQGGHVFLFAGKRAGSLATAMEDNDLEVPVVSSVSGNERIVIVRENLPYGFEVADSRTLVLGVNDIFGRVKKRVAKKKKKFTEDIFSDLKPGDIVVEEQHGRGRYLGLTTIRSDTGVGEYMQIEYRDGDKLYIPADKVDTVQKYVGSDGENVVLSKLGGQEWSKAKSKVRESTRKLAFNMMKLYSSRFSGRGHAFAKDTVWQRDFEDAFTYEETEGQLQSTEEIKRDMESPKPMDRLLLGDVGYGKTEVAMRAAFKAVMDGKQVAVLVPTTLLARQHLKTFQERFKGFPVNVVGLSRFTKGSQKQVLEDLESGKADIIIGTHRLLSKDVKFHDLGLLIVDEEQRFGVNHKEKIKTLKQQVDVLTLSATPIPRTLEMSLTGVRDMSTIETPPAMKKEPHTYVTRYAPGLLHDAVVREMKRKGQVYVVCRQIQQMDRIIADVQSAAPHARICAAHGRMSEREIEDVVSGFIDGQYDVLVCTTIIENGIDIPNVNTIIVHEADMFGLSQLYQLKGRVGRGEQTSYAYFTYDVDKKLNETAARRLQAIREFTELGSGFKIALRDLQIRGAGNMLGAEQSGHMATVGYAMYCRMMAEAVEEARGNPIPEEVETSVDLAVPGYIPDEYIASQADKMDIYRIIAKIKDLSDAKSVIAELKDRYGKAPKEVYNLVMAVLIRSYASRAGIESVKRRQGEIEFRFADGVVPDMKKLLQVASGNPDRVILKPQDPPVLAYKTKGVPGKQILELIAALGVPESTGDANAS